MRPGYVDRILGGRPASQRSFRDCRRQAQLLLRSDEWCALFKVSGDDGSGLWRVVFPTAPDETQQAAFAEEAVQARLQKFFPKSGPYPVVHRNIYAVHQRVAVAFRNGRTFLAGDSAHVNNPLGGLGLNFGIHDGMELSALLGRVIRGDAAPETLDLYDRFRRPLNVEYVQQQTIANSTQGQSPPGNRPCAKSPIPTSTPRRSTI